MGFRGVRGIHTEKRTNRFDGRRSEGKNGEMALCCRLPWSSHKSRPYQGSILIGGHSPTAGGSLSLSVYTPSELVTYLTYD